MHAGNCLWLCATGIWIWNLLVFQIIFALVVTEMFSRFLFVLQGKAGVENTRSCRCECPALIWLLRSKRCVNRKNRKCRKGVRFSRTVRHISASDNSDDDEDKSEDEAQIPVPASQNNASSAGQMVHAGGPKGNVVQLERRVRLCS